MLKKVLTIVLLAFCVFSAAMARPVEPTKARRVAEVYLQARGMQHTGELVDITTQTPFTELYIFAAPDGGFVLVSADDCVIPVLGYSTTSRFEAKSIPENVLGWLDDYEKEIRFHKRQQTLRDELGTASDSLSEAMRQWQMLLHGTMPPMSFLTSVSPLITTTWNQRPLYNNLCPLDTNSGDRSVTGCVATATAQVMKYFNHPTTGYGSNTYTSQRIVNGTQMTFSNLTANFGNTTYQWNNMPTALNSNSTATQIDAVATLMYHIGVAVEMKYSPSASGAKNYNYFGTLTASSQTALMRYFKYRPDMSAIGREDYTPAVYAAKLRAELDQSRPILYSGSNTSSGHSFVLDGYDNNGDFHINWGWGSYYDGYFTIGSLNPGVGGIGGNSSGTYNVDNVALIGIRPNTNWSTTATTTITATVQGGGGTVTGGGTYAFGDTASLLAMANAGYRFKEWSDGCKFNPREMVTTGGRYSFTATFEAISGDTMHYCPSDRCINSYGSSNSGDHKYWGIRLPSSLLASTNRLTAVQLYVGHAGTYDMTIYTGATHSTTVATTTLTFTTADEDQWKTIPLSNSIAATDDIWIVFHSNTVDYPATFTYYSGASGSFIYGQNLDDFSSYWQVSAMIKGIFTNNTSFICDTIVSRVCSTGQSLRYYLNCDTTATLLGYNDTVYGSLAIPASIDVDGIVYPVTSIGDSAFYGCSGFTGSLTIPNSVTYIGWDAFAGCSGFNGTLTIPNSVTFIGWEAFANCSGFTGSLSIPNSVTSIGDRAFVNCCGLTGALTIPNSVTSIGYEAFHGCRGFTGSLTLPNSVTSINGWAFYGCSGFNGALTIPNSVTSIGDWAFAGCSGFTGTLTIPNSVTSIGESAFAGCSGFNGALTIPNSVTSIGDGAFYYCSGFNGTLTIPNSVTSISESAFAGCSGFNGALTIPNSVTSIGGYAFHGCSGFNGALTIPNSVTSIGVNAFLDCSGLTSITVESGNTLYDSRGNCNAIIETSTNTLLTGCMNTVIPNSVTSIGDDAFYGCSGFNGALTIPNSVTSIGYNAFEGCSGFTSIISLATVPPILGSNVFFWIFTTIPIYVPCGSEAAYRADSGWNYFSNIQGMSNSYSIETDTACDVYRWHGRTFTASTDTATYITTNAAGCDSTITLHLTLNYSSNASETQTVCDSIIWTNHGTTNTYTTSDTYINLYTATNGCPSMDTLYLRVNHSSRSTETVTACNSYTWHDRTFSASTDTATYTTTNAAGCDSTVTLNLTINHCSLTQQTACDNFLWDVTGITYTTSGTYISGNDTLMLTVNYSSQGIDSITACDFYTWVDGLEYTEGSALIGNPRYRYANANAAGCDSIVTLNLTINFSDNEFIYDTICAGNAYTANNFNVPAADLPSQDTTYYRVIAGVLSNGCDSTIILNLTIYRDSSNSYTVSEVGSYTWVNHGISHTYTQSGTYTNSYTTTGGCAGTDTLHLTITTSTPTQYYTVRALSSNNAMGQASVVGDSRVLQGSTATVRATANSGYRFLRWSNGATSNPYTFTVTRDTLLTAIFEGNSYTVTIVNGNPGRGIVNGSSTAAYGSHRNISAAPNYGYTFSHWSDGDSNASRTITITSNVTLTAYFGIRQFRVDAQPANYAQGTVSGGGSYDYQAYATLTATPRNGYVFHHWSDGDTVNPRRLQVLRDTALTAYFLRSTPTYTLTVTSADPTMGSTFGGGTYDEGSTATIRAAANDGYEFESWADGVTSNPRNVTILSDTTFTATFRAVYVPQDYTVTVTSNNAALGRVTGGGTYREGRTVHLGAYPSTHCHFVSWSDGNTSAQRTITVTRDIALTATFASDSVVITARANDERLGHVTGSGAYAIGTTATLTATPNNGCRFLRWSTGERERSINVTVRSATTYTAYFAREAQGIDEADETTTVRVWSHAMTIHVSGLTGEPVKVYDVTGRLIAERPNATGDIAIPVTHLGLYLVQTGTTHKVLVQ